MKRVITYGVFDVFHEGHLRLLQRAKALGDELIVGVTTDQFAYQRGKMGLAETLETRLLNVRNCPCVDKVIVEDHYGQKAEDIERYGVDVFVAGDDWLGKFDFLKPLCEVVYLPRTAGISSSFLRENNYPVLRLGLVGCGRIAERFLLEAGHVREIIPVSLYHPHPDDSASVRAFRERHPSVSLARTPEKLYDQTDAVYIASPHGTHAAYARQALEAGRHVLCEKPMGFRAEEVEDLFALARSRRLVLMEAVKTAYCPGFLNLVSLVRSGIVGEVFDVRSCFTRLTPAGTREWTDKAFGGSLTEFGSYTLLPILKILGTEGLEWRFESAARDGVDCFTRVYLRSGEKTGEAVNGLSVKSAGELVVSGTTGYIRVEAPWWKTRYFEAHREDPQEISRFAFDYKGDGLRYELADFLYRIRGYPGRENRLYPRESIRMAEILGDFLKTRAGS